MSLFSYFGMVRQPGADLRQRAEAARRQAHTATNQSIKSEVMALLEWCRQSGFEPPITSAGSGQDIHIPSTGETLFALKLTSDSDYDRAVSTASSVAKDIYDKRFRGMVPLLDAMRDVIIENRVELASALRTLVKTDREAHVEIDELLSVLELTKHTAFSQLGETYAAAKPGQELRTEVEPLGDVSGQLGVCNFPVSITAKHLFPSLCAGVTHVVKTPDTSGALATLIFKYLFDIAADRAGYPKDAFQVVIGGKELGQKMAKDPRLCVLAATGGSEMIKAVRMAAAEDGKKLILEGTGHNLVVSTDDSGSPAHQELLACLEASMSGMGALRCTTLHTAVERAGSGIQLLDSMIDVATKLTGRPADPRDPHAVITAMYSPGHLAALDDHTEQLLNAGGKLRFEERLPLPNEFADGYFPPLRIIEFTADNVAAASAAYGPTWNVVTLNEDEIYALLRDQKHALANSFFSTDMTRVQQFYRATRSGVSNVCTPPNGNEVGGAGFRPGTARTGGNTSVAAGVKSPFDYCRTMFSRVNYRPGGLPAGRRGLATAAAVGVPVMASQLLRLAAGFGSSSA